MVTEKNNHVDNLEWTTVSGNTKHAIEIGLIKTKRLKEHSMIASKFIEKGINRDLVYECFGFKPNWIL